MKTKTTIIEITQEDIVNVLADVLYSSHWLSCYYDNTEYKKLENKSNDDCVEDKLAKLLLAGKTITLVDTYAEDEDDVNGNLEHEWDEELGGIAYKVTIDDFKRGIEKCFNSDEMYKRESAYKVFFTDYTGEYYDADIVVQTIVLGDYIYG